MNHSPFITSAERHLPEALDFVRRLVLINSYTANPAGVNAVARLTAEAFVPLGFSANFIPCSIPETGDHLLLTHPGNGGAPLVLVTHSDTVFPPEEEFQNGFKWDEHPEERRIYGPGTIDNKGGTALIWLMLQILRECAPDFFSKTHWLIASNAAEEITGDDFGCAIDEYCGGNARAVLVFEGGPVDEQGWHIVTSRKGRSTWRLTASGKAAHAGSKHHEGINAIDALALVLPEIAAQTNPAEDLSVNIGIVHGGTVVNRVPHQAFAEWECRATSPDALKRADDFFSSLTGTTANGAHLTATRTGHTAAWHGSDASQALYKLWENAASAVNLTTLPVPRGGLSDANHLSHLGPTLDGLGPFGGNAHCSERSTDGTKVPEFIDPTSLVPKAVMNVLALLNLTP